MSISAMYLGIVSANIKQLSVSVNIKQLRE